MVLEYIGSTDRCEEWCESTLEVLHRSEEWCESTLEVLTGVRSGVRVHWKY